MSIRMCPSNKTTLELNNDSIGGFAGEITPVDRGRSPNRGRKDRPDPKGKAIPETGCRDALSDTATTSKTVDSKKRSDKRSSSSTRSSSERRTERHQNEKYHKHEFKKPSSSYSKSKKDSKQTNQQGKRNRSYSPSGLTPPQKAGPNDKKYASRQHTGSC